MNWLRSISKVKEIRPCSHSTIHSEPMGYNKALLRFTYLSHPAALFWIPLLLVWEPLPPEFYSSFFLPVDPRTEFETHAESQGQFHWHLPPYHKWHPQNRLCPKGQQISSSWLYLFPPKVAGKKDAQTLHSSRARYSWICSPKTCLVSSGSSSDFGWNS